MARAAQSVSLLGPPCGLGSVFPPSRWVTSGPLLPRLGAPTRTTPCYAQGPLPPAMPRAHCPPWHGCNMTFALWPLRWTLRPSGGLGAFVRPAHILEVALGIWSLKGTMADLQVAIHSGLWIWSPPRPRPCPGGPCVLGWASAPGGAPLAGSPPEG